MIRLTSLRQTTGACPSQWEGTTDDGRFVYARYRFGELTIGVGASVEDAVVPFGGDNLLLAVEVGGEWDGAMTTDEMLRHAKDVLLLAT